MKIHKRSRSIKTKYYPPAIEISSTAIKLLQLCKTGPAVYELAKFDYLLFEQKDPSPAVIRGALEKLVRENSLAGEVVSSLSLAELQTFTYALPDMPPLEIEQAVRWKLKQNPPAGMEFENISFDYVSCISELIKGLRILVFVVPRETAIERVKLFKEFSLALISLEPKPYAALNGLFWSGSIANDETVMVLQLGSTQSAVAIIHRGFPYLMRSLGVCGNIFTGAMATQLQLDWQEAEDLKNKEGIAASGSSLLSQLESLIIDIEHSFKYFSHQLIKSQVTFFQRLILLGGASQMPGLDKFLSDRLAVRVEVFKPSLLKENAASFASTLGLAVRHIEK